jgi:hypothetical protein
MKRAPGAPLGAAAVGRLAWIAVAVLALAATAPATHAAAAPAPAKPAPSPRRPDFSGTWKLDVTKSEFGKVPGTRPRARTDVIEHRDPRLTQTLHLDNTTRRDTTRYSYTTDGKPCVNHVDEQKITATVRWEGTVLRLESKTKLMLLEMKLDERWTLSPDGRKLTMKRELTSSIVSGIQTLTFEKQ